MKYLGVCFVSERALECAVFSKGLGSVDPYGVILLPAWLINKRRDLLEELHASGKIVVVHSAARDALNQCNSSQTVGQSIRYMSATEEISIVLTGCRSIDHFRYNLVQTRDEINSNN